MTTGPTPEIPEPAETSPASVPAGYGGDDRRRPSLGQIVVGVVLVLIGIAWLLEALDAVDVPWRSLLPAALIVVGVALVFGAREGRHGGLIALGVVLTLAVLLTSVVEVLLNVPIAGGVGEQTHRPVAAVEDEYRWALGSMTLDLRDAEPAPGQTIEASVTIGELVVILPPATPVRVSARVGLGEVDLLGDRSSGMGAERETTEPGSSDLATRLDLDVAIGKIEVRR
jgi:hypothetical protein